MVHYLEWQLSNAIMTEIITLQEINLLCYKYMYKLFVILYQSHDL